MIGLLILSFGSWVLELTLASGMTSGSAWRLKQFPRLFKNSNQQHMVVDMGSWTNGSWSWKLTWGRSWFKCERVHVDKPFTLINSSLPNQHHRDAWVWAPDPS
ncbi:hypothetical protein Fmac_021555 [Flemingia macrophylla]|uniref:Secreted protein n=1 Tax=Flemingia macrophylla TaxID=520843 RepID=A0ABD1LXS4_9FABA